MQIQGTTALITGASRGLGRALMRELAGRGASVVGTARHREELDEVVAEIRVGGGRAWGIVADVGEADSARIVAGEAAALMGPVDLLIHNASTLGPLPMPLLLDTPPEQADRVFQVNVLGPFRLTRAVAGSMLLRGRGVVVSISSDAAVEAYPQWGVYSASKAALDHLSRVWAAELEGTGVRFFAVDPGEMNTTMHRDALPYADPASLGDPAQVALHILRLITDPTRAPSGSRVTTAGREVLS